jgi:hypothetical protein
MFAVDTQNLREYKMIKTQLTDAQIKTNANEVINSVVLKDTEFGVRALITWTPGGKYEVLA